MRDGSKPELMKMWIRGLDDPNFHIVYTCAKRLLDDYTYRQIGRAVAMKAKRRLNSFTVDPATRQPLCVDPMVVARGGWRRGRPTRDDKWRASRNSAHKIMADLLVKEREREYGGAEGARK